MLIIYSRLFRAVDIDKTQHESEDRLVEILPGDCLASCRNSLVGSSSSECHTVVRHSVTAKLAASFSLNTLLGSTSFPRISELSQVLLDSVLKSIAASSLAILTLETI